MLEVTSRVISKQEPLSVAVSGRVSSAANRPGGNQRDTSTLPGLRKASDPATRRG